MSILIKGIDMPKYESLTIKIMPSGAVCDQYGRLDERVGAVEVPTPHGRLVDADAFEKKNEYFWNRDFINPRYDDTLSDLVNAAPTIIEAEE